MKQVQPMRGDVAGVLKMPEKNRSLVRRLRKAVETIKMKKEPKRYQRILSSDWLKPLWTYSWMFVLLLKGKAAAPKFTTFEVLFYCYFQSMYIKFF